MRSYWEVDVYLYALTSALDGEWSASRPGHFTPGGKSPRYALDRRLGGIQSRDWCGGEKKIPSPCRESNPYRPTLSLFTILTELRQLPSFNCRGARKKGKMYRQSNLSAKFNDSVDMATRLALYRVVLGSNPSHMLPLMTELSMVFVYPSIRLGQYWGSGLTAAWAPNSRGTCRMAVGATNCPVHHPSETNHDCCVPPLDATSRQRLITTILNWALYTVTCLNISRGPGAATAHHTSLSRTVTSDKSAWQHGPVIMKHCLPYLLQQIAIGRSDLPTSESRCLTTYNCLLHSKCKTKPRHGRAAAERTKFGTGCPYQDLTD
jgi:hypothetical protein